MSAVPTVITVGYERKLSDGNYGSVGLSMMVSVPVEVDEAVSGALSDYAHRLRREVLSKLIKSGPPRVARAAAEELNPRPRVAAGVDDSEDPEDLPF